MKKNNNWMLYLCAAVFLFCGVIAITNTVSKKIFFVTAEKTTGTIIDVVKTTHTNNKKNAIGRPRHETITRYTVTVSYEYKGVKYTGNPGRYDGSKVEGDTITIYVNPKNPAEIWAQEDTGFEFWASIVTGFICLAIGIGCLIPSVIMIRKMMLKKNGLCYRLPIVDVETGNIRVNNQLSNRVVLEDRKLDENVTYIYKSDSIYEDMSGYVGSKAMVYVDAKDPDFYYVDVKSIY